MLGVWGMRSVADPVRRGSLSLCASGGRGKRGLAQSWLLSLCFPQRALPCALGVTATLLAGILLAPYSVPVVLLFLCSGAALSVRCVLEKDLQKAEKVKFPSE